MHSVFRLPWSSEPVGDKLVKGCSSVDFPFVNKLKRKLADTADHPPSQNQRRLHSAKKSRQLPTNIHAAPNLISYSYTPLPVQVIHPSICDQPIAERTVEVPVEKREQHRPTVSEPKTAQPKNLPLLEKPLRAYECAGKPVKNNQNVTKASPKETSVLSSENIQPESAECKIKSTSAEHLNKARESIEAHFNYEILLKHRETQLIEQEIAKCQISLEQLRRCHLIPFPGSLAMSEDVSGGVGPALKACPSFTQPECPSPWGVADGPYSRHYAKWLLPDKRFDSLSCENAFAFDGRQLLSEGRTTRAAFGDSFSSASIASGKVRLSRTSAGKRPYAHGIDNQPTPRERQGPLVIKRSTDGQNVKLVCNDCHRGNFSSAQGFLNHCRIAHHRDYKSHDAAAIACGQPIDHEEAENILAIDAERRNLTRDSNINEPSKLQNRPHQFQPHPHTLNNNPVSSVHPLIASEGKPHATCSGSFLCDIPPRHFTKSTKHQAQIGLESSQMGAISSQIPRLSGLLNKQGFHGNLDDMIANMREAISSSTVEEPDMNTYDDNPDGQAEPLPEGLTVASDIHKPTTTSKLHTAREIVATSLSRVPSAVGIAHFDSCDSKLCGSSSSPPLLATRTAQTLSTVPTSGLCSKSIPYPDHVSGSSFTPEMDLSPNTVESSNPGLVSDRDDDYLDEDDLETDEVAHRSCSEYEQDHDQKRKLKIEMPDVELSEVSPDIHVTYFLGDERSRAHEDI